MLRKYSLFDTSNWYSESMTASPLWNKQLFTAADASPAVVWGRAQEILQAITDRHQSPVNASQPSTLLLSPTVLRSAVALLIVDNIQFRQHNPHWHPYTLKRVLTEVSFRQQLVSMNIDACPLEVAAWFSPDTGLYNAMTDVEQHSYVQDCVQLLSAWEQTVGRRPPADTFPFLQSGETTSLTERLFTRRQPS